MNNSRARLIRRSTILAMILFTLAVYSYPALETWAKTGSTNAPPILAPDTGFYIFVSKMTALHSDAALNPYYGIEVPLNATPHLRFPLAFRLFGYLNSLLGGRLWLALFTWNLLWWGLLCGIAVWLFEDFLPDKSFLLVAAGLGLLMWLNFGLLKPQVLAWVHFPSLSGFGNIGLPYARPFFPQLPIPFLLAYLGLQMSALRTQRVRVWVWMGLLQFLAFAIFPYTTLMMAGITLVATIWLIAARLQSVPWRNLIAYGTLCAAVDLAYLRLVPVTRDYQSQPSPFHIEPSVLPHLVGGMWFIIAFLTLAIALVRGLPAEVKWPLVGLGLANMGLMVGDVFFSETALMISHHAGYFVHPTVAVLLAFLLSAACLHLRATTRSARLALGVVVILLAVNAMLLAKATYRDFLPINEQQVETVRLLRSIPVMPNDLLIVHARISDDACEWAPLASGAKVLYCRDASALLDPNQNHTIQRFRQALYLFFTGMDSRQMQGIADDPRAFDQQMRLAYFGGIVPFRKEEREEGLRTLRTELIPLLDAADRHDPSMLAFLRQYSRILVVDNLHDPVFDRARLASYLDLQKELPRGDLTVLFCDPK